LQVSVQRGRGGTVRRVDDLLETVTSGNVAEVKIVLASVVAALAVYQLVLIAVGYGKLRLPFLGAPTASFAHRATGDAIVLLTAIVALMCLTYHGYGEDESTAHMVAGTALVVALAVKVAVVRRGRSLGRYLPVFGLVVFGLIAATWLTSAGDFLADR
jgi:hypothetical protein